MSFFFENFLEGFPGILSEVPSLILLGFLSGIPLQSLDAICLRNIEKVFLKKYVYEIRQEYFLYKINKIAWKFLFAMFLEVPPENPQMQ